MESLYIKKIITLFFFFICSQLFSQQTFQRAFGTGVSETPTNLKLSSDGGYIFTGGSNSSGIIIKLNSAGILQWSRTLTGVTNNVYDIIQTVDDGYVFSGIWGSGSSSEAIIAKLDAGGNFIWRKTIGGASYEEGYTLKQTPDGGYILAGRTTSIAGFGAQIMLVRLDSAGTVLWCKTIGGTGTEGSHTIIKTADGGYALAGSTNSYGAGLFDFLLIKFDSDFNIQWSRTAGSPNNEYIEAFIQTYDKCYLMTGVNYISPSGLEDMYVVKFDSTGSQQWTKIIDYTTSDEAFGVLQTPDGGYVLAGFTQISNYEGYLVKINSSGNFQWSINSKTWASSVIPAADGGYAIGGTDWSFGVGGGDFGIVKFDSSWNTCGNVIIGGGTSTAVTCTVTSPPLTATLQTMNVTTPTITVSSNSVQTDICSVTGIKLKNTNSPNEYALYQNYPNPFNPNTVISYQLLVSSFATLKIYDVLGNEVSTLVNEKQNAGKYQVEFDGTNYPSGVFFYKLVVGEFTETKKLILLK